MAKRKTCTGSLLLLAVALAGCKTPQESAGPTPKAAAPTPQPPLARAADVRETLTPEPARQRGPRAQKGGTPGSFDFYLLTLSWSPEFCSTHSSDPECAPRPGGPYGFLVHGLWPQNNNGTFPENCSQAPGPADPAAYSDIIPDASLIAHEWTTHGTCSGLAPDAFFQLARKAFQEVVIPPQFTGTNEPKMLPPAQIIGDFAQVNASFPKAAFVLSCGSNRLTAMEFCLSRTLTPIACQAVKTCRANSVKITPR